MYSLFKAQANGQYWGFLVAMQCVDLSGMPESGVYGLVEAMKILAQRADLNDVFPVEWERMREMEALFEEKVLRRQQEIGHEKEEQTYS